MVGTQTPTTETLNMNDRDIPRAIQVFQLTFADFTTLQTRVLAPTRQFLEIDQLHLKSFP